MHLLFLLLRWGRERLGVDELPFLFDLLGGEAIHRVLDGFELCEALRAHDGRERLAVARDSDFLVVVDEAVDRDERVFSAQVVEGGLSATVALSRKPSRKHVGSGPLAIGF